MWFIANKFNYILNYKKRTNSINICREFERSRCALVILSPNHNKSVDPNGGSTCSLIETLV